MAFRIPEIKISDDEFDDLILEASSGPRDVIWPYLKLSGNLLKKFNVQAALWEIDASLARLRKKRKVVPLNYTLRLIESLGSRLS